MGRHLGIDFSWILMDFGSQVGKQNGAKIDPKRRRKNNRKKKGTRMHRKSQYDTPTLRETTGPGSRGGGRGRGKPLPEGRREEGKGLLGRWPTLNHSSPGAGGMLTGAFQTESSRAHFILEMIVFGARGRKKLSLLDENEVWTFHGAISARK